jgi:hypothetical protein
MTAKPYPYNSSYLPTTIVFPTDPNEFMVQLTKMYADIANRINNRQLGNYEEFEYTTGQQFFSLNVSKTQAQVKRQPLRRVFVFGAIAAGATATASSITGVTSFTNLYGTCITSNPDYRPLPYVDVTLITNQIQLYSTISGNTTTVTIVNGSTAPNITSALVVAEFLR